MKVKDLLKTENIIVVAPQDNLSSVLAQLQSSHDVGFVFQNKQFEGVVSPYYTVIKKTFPGNTKVQSCLFHPPRLKPQDDVKKAARLMMESKIHYLPVFSDDGNFEGIVSSRRILSHMLKDDFFTPNLRRKVGAKKILTIGDQEPTSKALNMFKENKVSKLVLTNDKGVLAGIVSQYDIADMLAVPRERRNFDAGEKDSRLDKPIRNFAKSLVITLPGTATFSEAIMHMLEQKIGSIVIVDSMRKPIGIVTTKDILKFMAPRQTSKILNISTEEIGVTNEKVLHRALKSIEEALRKHNIFGGTMIVKGKKGGGVFDVTLSYDDVKGFISIHLEGKKFPEMVHELVKKVISQLDK